jgi:hypothetical protein
VVSSKLIDLSNATHREYLLMMEYKGQAIFYNTLDYLDGRVASKINGMNLCKLASI